MNTVGRAVQNCRPDGKGAWLFEAPSKRESRERVSFFENWKLSGFRLAVLTLNDTSWLRAAARPAQGRFVVGERLT